jgi:hypothetical protein
MTAYTAIVFARYAMLALENRMQQDERAFGALFYSVCNELADIKFAEAFFLLMSAFLDATAEKLFLAKEELEALLACFISNLSETLNTKLLRWLPNAQKSLLELAGY